MPGSLSGGIIDLGAMAKKKTKTAFTPREISTRPQRLFAVGDIHGCNEELKHLLNFLRNDQKLSGEDQLVFIGDYIDRGPDSKGVIDTLLQVKNEFPSTVFLKGNHEDMLLDYLGLGGQGGDVYLTNGGSDFFRSYEIPAYDKANIVSKLPAAHVEFLKGLELAVSLAEFIFVHAGLNPQKS